MRNVSRRMLATASLALALGVAGNAWAQSTPVTGIQVSRTYTGEARVSAVDMATRNVTLSLADGRSATMKVSDAVQNLGQVKPGDMLVVTFMERTSYVLTAPGATTPTDRTVSVAGQPAGDRPGRAMGTQSVGTWTVVSTDLAQHTISLVNPQGGEVVTFDVTTAEGRSQLPRAKPGDKLTIIETETLVASIRPKA